MGGFLGDCLCLYNSYELAMNRRSLASKIPSTDASKVVVYMRVSTNEEKQANSFQIQRDACLAWVRREGKVVVAEEHDEVTGGASLEDRPGMQRALLALERHNAGVLLAHKVDRFGRSVVESLEILKRLKNLGVSVSFADGGTSPDDAMGIMLFQILMSVAEYEKSQIQRRVQDTMNLKRSRGEYLGGNIPFGYSVISVDAPGTKRGTVKRLVPNLNEQATLERIRQLRSNGLGWRRVSKVAQEEGLLNRFGKPMDPSMLWRMFHQEQVFVPAYGFTGEMTENADEQRVLSQLLRRRLEGAAYSEIALELRTSGIKTREGRTPGWRWVKARVQGVSQAIGWADLASEDVYKSELDQAGDAGAEETTALEPQPLEQGALGQLPVVQQDQGGDPGLQVAWAQ